MVLDIDACFGVINSVCPMIYLLWFGFIAGPLGGLLQAGWYVGFTLIRFYLIDNPLF